MWLAVDGRRITGSPTKVALACGELLSYQLETARDFGASAPEGGGELERRSFEVDQGRRQTRTGERKTIGG
jgi:hypothetical protein